MSSQNNRALVLLSVLGFCYSLCVQVEPGNPPLAPVAARHQDDALSVAVKKIPSGDARGPATSATDESAEEPWGFRPQVHTLVSAAP